MKQILSTRGAVWRSIALCTLATGAMIAVDNRFVPSAPADASSQAIFDKSVYYYGTGDGIQVWQYDVLSNLQFPQSYNSIVDRLGYPDARSDDGLVDFYQLPAGGYVGVEYGSDGRAIGFSTQMGG